MIEIPNPPRLITDGEISSNKRGAKLPPIECKPKYIPSPIRMHNMEKNYEEGKSWVDYLANGYILWGGIAIVSIGAIVLKYWWLETFIKSICYIN